MKLDPKAMESIRQRERQMELDRTEFDPIWQDIRQYLLPWHGRNLQGCDNDEDKQGRLKKHKILDGTATRALGVTAAGMQAGINSPARPWFKLGYSDKDLTEFKPVRLWLDTVERTIRDIYARSNVYNMLHHIYLELASFGTAASAIRPSFGTVIRARPMTIGEFWLALNNEGVVDTFMRRFRMTAIQMINEFGEDNVSQAVLSAYNGKRTEETFTITMFVEPNDDRIPFPFGEGKEYRVVYHEKGFENSKALRVSGSEKFNILAPRWHTVGMMAYGFGPGVATLTDIKGLQKEYEKKLVAQDKMVDPPLRGPSKLEGQIVNTMPGGITYDDTLSAGQGLQPLYQVNFDMNASIAGIMDTRNAIRQGLFTDLFTMIANTVDVTKTATEVAALKEEKMMVLGPVLDSVHNEVHKPLIDSAFHYAEKAGLLPEPPEDIEGMNIEVEYISILAQAQKMVATSGIEQLAGFVGNLSPVFPEARFKFNATEAIDEYASALGTSAKIINSDEEVAAMQQAEAQQAQAMQAMQAAATAADSAKVLSETDMGGNSALTALMGGMNG
jgi:hypothetical protein